MVKPIIKILGTIMLLVAASGRGYGQPAEQLESHIRQLEQTIQNRRLLVSQLRPDRSLMMPVGIGSEHSGQPPIIIDDLVLHADRAEFRAYAVLKPPGSQNPIYFATPEPVTLSFKGGISGSARMELVTDKEIPMGVGDASLFIKKENSFIEFGCEGFLQAGLGIEVTLPSKLVKENPDGSQLNKRVKGQFSTVFSDPNNILASVVIEPFQLKGVEGLTFTVKDAVVDLSDFTNSLNMVFPTGYVNDHLGDADPELWRGIYLRNVSVMLPEEIRDHSVSGRKEFGVRDLLIDGQGVSGEIFARNLVHIENGDLGGWAYSVEEVSIGLSASQVQYASLRGGLNLPIAGESLLGYTCLFNPGKEYLFNVETREALAFKIFQAGEVTLSKGSNVEVALVQRRFEAMANLSGKMTIHAGLGRSEDETPNTTFKIADVRFEQLTISTQAPYLHSGYFDAGANVKIGTFEGSLSNIKLIRKQESRGLGVDLKVSLMNSKDGTNSFAADASLQILGSVKNNQGRQKYDHSSTEFTRIWLDIDQGVFKLRGGLNFFSESPAFGQGFKGQILANIKPGIQIGATALFGQDKGVKYWYADALAGFPGVPVAGAVEIDAFAGGLYYGVKQKPGDGQNIGVVNSQTGLTYLPDATAGLGLRAAVRFGLKEKKDVFNGNLGFEIAFNKNGGLSRIFFMGNANFLQEPSDNAMGELKSGSKFFAATGPGNVNNTSAFDQLTKRGDLAASVLIEMNLDNNSLFANLKTYINVAGGQLKGVNAGGMAGEGAMYFGPDTWYIHLGTPTSPIGVELAGIARTTAYFMVGKDLPASPLPPRNVSEILQGQNFDYMRDLNALKSGRGLAFGAGLNFDTGNLTFLIFYARFAAGAGFDVMLKDYGNQAMSNGKPLGINGWYANGEVYAYLQGKIGIMVTVFGSFKKFDIIDLGTAAVLQAKLPNPTWMHGVVGGYYRILGGMIKGTCRFEFTLGKEPHISGTDVLATAGVQVIAEVSPKNSEKDVDVFAIPQAIFNIPVGEQFSITDPVGRKITFRARLDHFAVTDGSKTIPGKLEWNADNTVLALLPTDLLPSERKLDITARVVFEENRQGSWQPYLINGVPYKETVTSSFNTGVPPGNIPHSNIAYSYPAINQLNYYKNESRTGYIKLKRGQDYLFDPDNEIRPVGRIRSQSGVVKEFNITYGNNEVKFTMPDIEPDMGYELSLVGIPQGAPVAKDANVITEERLLVPAGISDASVTTRKADVVLNGMEEQRMFELNFRTSRFRTLGEKLRQAGNAYSYTLPLRSSVHRLGYVMNIPEMFEDLEICEKDPLIRLEAELIENAWYQTYMHPVYSNNGSPMYRINWRDINHLGAPPRLAVSVRNANGLTGLKYLAGQPAIVSGSSSFLYDVPHYAERDYMEIQARVANTYVSSVGTQVPADMRTILQTPFMPVRRGPYLIRISYRLPGSNTVTSVNYITINNEIGY